MGRNSRIEASRVVTRDTVNERSGSEYVPSWGGGRCVIGDMVGWEAEPEVEDESKGEEEGSVDGDAIRSRKSQEQYVLRKQVSGSVCVWGDRETRSVGCCDAGVSGKGYSVEPAPERVGDVVGWLAGVAAEASCRWKQLDSVVRVCLDGEQSVSSVEFSTRASPEEWDEWC